MRPVPDNRQTADVQDDPSYNSQGDSNTQQSFVTVFFRLASYDSSPSQLSGQQLGIQPVTPLHTPFIQSPATSPNMKITGIPDNMSYGPGVPMIPPPTPGVYYSSAPVGPHQFYPTGPVVANSDEAHFKQRALSAEIHHSPQFHYQAPAHRLSFNISGPADKDGLSYVSAEMLLSAMPERYDD
jgi:hypothetical protein